MPLRAPRGIEGLATINTRFVVLIMDHADGDGSRATPSPVVTGGKADVVNPAVRFATSLRPEPHPRPLDHGIRACVARSCSRGWLILRHRCHGQSHRIAIGIRHANNSDVHEPVVWWPELAGTALGSVTHRRQIDTEGPGDIRCGVVVWSAFAMLKVRATSGAGS